MKRKELERLLTLLLEGRGIPWVREGELIRFRLRNGGAEWEVNCRCGDGLVECYGRYPFSLSDRPLALGRCNEINLRSARGAMLLPPDGRPVFRTVADADDVFDAESRVSRALDDNARGILHFWRTLAGAEGNPSL